MRTASTPEPKYKSKAPSKRTQRNHRSAPRKTQLKQQQAATRYPSGHYLSQQPSRQPSSPSTPRISDRRYHSLLGVNTWKKLQDVQRQKDTDRAHTPRTIPVKVVERERRRWRAEVDKLSAEIAHLRQRMNGDAQGHESNEIIDAEMPSENVENGQHFVAAEPDFEQSQSTEYDESGEEHGEAGDHASNMLEESSEPVESQSVQRNQSSRPTAQSANQQSNSQPTIDNAAAHSPRKQSQPNSSLSDREYQQQIKAATKMAQDAMAQCDAMLKEKEQEIQMAEQHKNQKSELQQRLHNAEEFMQSLLDEAQYEKKRKVQVQSENENLKQRQMDLEKRLHEAEQTMNRFYHKYEHAVQLLQVIDPKLAEVIEEGRALNEHLASEIGEVKNTVKQRDDYGKQVSEAEERIDQFGEENAALVSKMMEA